MTILATTVGGESFVGKEGGWGGVNIHCVVIRAPPGCWGERGGGGFHRSRWQFLVSCSVWGRRGSASAQTQQQQQQNADNTEIFKQFCFFRGSRNPNLRCLPGEMALHRKQCENRPSYSPAAAPRPVNGKRPNETSREG